VSSDRLDTQRQRRELHEQLRALSFAPLMRGTLYERLRKCGRKACACARDPEARHKSHFLSVFLDGRSRGFHVRPVDVERVRAATAAYERLWEIINGLTACEVADLRREARERQRSRQRSGDGA
jgi:hypothetical protein